MQVSKHVGKKQDFMLSRYITSKSATVQGKAAMSCCIKGLVKHELDKAEIEVVCSCTAHSVAQ